MGTLYINPYSVRGLVETAFGTAGDTNAGNRSYGSVAGVPYAGFFFTAPGTGEFRQAVWNCSSGANAGNIHGEFWSVSGNNPGAQIGADTANVAVANGDNTFVFANLPIVGGTRYCCVLVSTGGNGNFLTKVNNVSYGSDRDASAITGLDQTAGIDGFNEDWAVTITCAI